LGDSGLRDGRQQAFTQQGRPLGEIEEEIGLQEVEDQALGKGLPQEGRLADFPGAPEEGGPACGQVNGEQAAIMNHCGGVSEILLPFRSYG